MLEKEKNDTAERGLVVTQLLDAPVELVWKVWTDPEHIRQWWGPDGFTNTISKMEFRTGGEWDLVMHAPDGKNYNNRFVFREVTPMSRIVFDHNSIPPFLATITLEAQGDKTFLSWEILFNTREEFLQAVKTNTVDAGLRQNVERLNKYAANRE
jgi:uncharacterized protein YndB with AHSA1/START domain